MELGGCHSATCVVLPKTPQPRSIGGELGAELQAEALLRGLAPNPAASCAPSLDHSGLRRTGSQGGKAHSSAMRSK